MKTCRGLGDQQRRVQIATAKLITLHRSSEVLHDQGEIPGGRINCDVVGVRGADRDAGLQGGVEAKLPLVGLHHPRRLSGLRILRWKLADHAIRPPDSCAVLPGEVKTNAFPNLSGTHRSRGHREHP